MTDNILSVINIFFNDIKCDKQFIPDQTAPECTPPHRRRNRKKFSGTSGYKGVKMSPSLFNFVDAKDKFTVRNHRIAFLCYNTCNYLPYAVIKIIAR